LFVFFNCEKEDSLVKEPIAVKTDTQKPPTIKTVSYQKIPPKFNALEHHFQLTNHLFEDYNPDKFSKDNSESEKVIIHTDVIKEVTFNDYTSYTMRITAPNTSSNKLYNLTIEDKNGEEGMFLTIYTYTSSTSKGGGKGTFGAITTEKVSFETISDVIDGEDNSAEGSGSNSTTSTNYPYNCDGDVIINYEQVPYQCTCEGHWPGDYCTCYNQPGYTTELVYTCVVSVGDNEGGYDTDENAPDGGTGGSGSTGGTSDPDDSSITTPVGDVECEDLEGDLNEDCFLSDDEDEFNIFYKGLTKSQKNCLDTNGGFNNDTYNFLVQNLFSDSSKSFAAQAVDAFCNGGEVDFDEERINGVRLDSNLPPCLESMILDLMLGNFPYSDSMENIELIEDTFSSLGGSYSPNPIGIVVTYKTGNISGSGETASQGYDSSTQTINITVTISDSLVNNGTKIAIVKTILHESIHAYLLKLKQEYPLYFNSSDEFSQLVSDYQNYTNANDPQHIYMASIITNMANNVSNYVQEKYAYPQSTIDYYEAVCWSGITHLTTGSLNPLFSNNYPSSNDQENIIKIFNTENGTASYQGYSPLINNNCN